MAVYPYGNTCLVQELIQPDAHLQKGTFTAFGSQRSFGEDRLPDAGTTRVLKIEPGSKRCNARCAPPFIIGPPPQSTQWLSIEIGLVGVGKKT